MTARFPAPALIDFASELLVAAGLDHDKAETVAEILTEGDLLGHTTHGLNLLPLYLADLEKGSMAKAGGPEVLADFPAAVTWDGRRLPGPWLVTQALALAVKRARQNGTGTVVIRRSHHIACLAAYLRPVAEQGLLVLLSCSDPTLAGVAPHGGRTAVITPDPLAAAWPTDHGPVILDVSMSITSLGLARRLQAEGRPLPGAWALDAQGRPTTDPAAVLGEPPGALLPLGGLDHGHKGYALGLLVEALTGGLAGHGRADPAEGWTGTVFVQVLNPALFGGREDFLRQTTWVADACRATPPREGFDRVRLPGESALAKRKQQLALGVELYPGIMDALRPWAEKLDVLVPPANGAGG